MIPARAIGRYLFAAWMAGLSACNLTPGGGTDVGNPDLNARVSGSLKHLDGSPAAFVPLHLRPKAFLSNPDSVPVPPTVPLNGGKTIQDGVSDTQGFFSFDSVPKGEYRIEAIDTLSRGAVMDVSPDGHSERLTLAPAFMAATGWISGTVVYRGPPQSRAPKIIIAIYGTDRWTASTTSGDFTLSGLPPGKYTIRISTLADAALITIPPEIVLGQGEKVSVGSVDLGP